MNAQRAFSLIELLVVVVIIAVLAAMGMPAYQNARASTRRVECQQNLKQIYTALVSYAGENNNMLPPTYVSTGNGNDGQEQAWGYLIWPYVYGSRSNWKYPENCLQMGTPVYSICMRNVFRCPATKQKVVPVPGVPAASVKARYSYGLNCDPARPPGATSSVALPIPLLSVPASTTTAMIMETSFPVGNRYGYFEAYGLIPHMGGVNVLYFDGHCEGLTLAQVPNDQSNLFWMGH